MPTFAPPYNPPTHQQSFLPRHHKAQIRKRKRDQDSSDDEAATPAQPSPSPEPTPRTAASSFHPVNKTDPYYIAGHPREHALPPPPFPHAAVKEANPPKIPIEEELASLNPPLYVPPKAVEDKSTSLKRRHLDNITAILHKCMLKGDWKRAHRAWSLVIRTEVNGRGIDVRRHGRWGIGAELLMRQAGRPHLDQQSDEQDDIDAENSFTDEGFKLARSYYERLILQYPHTQHTQHHLNATAIYPALFNIWIYSVQDRAKRARKALNTHRADSEGNVSSVGSEKRPQLRQIETEELEEAIAIAARMDELVLSPPYDTDTTLVELRGMVALWLADLHTETSGAASKDTSQMSDLSADFSDNVTLSSHKHKANDERRKARDLFSKLESQGVELAASTRHFLENQED